MPLYSGHCETDITPPPGVWMAGYAGRSTGATGVHDPLFARALVLDNGHRRLALIAADLIALDFDLVARVREGVAAELGVETASVMLHCTHTHGGPSVRRFRAMGSRDDAYTEILVRKLIGVAAMAARDLEPVALSYGEAAVQIGVNRRRPLQDGRVALQPNYAGPTAPRVQCLCVQSVEGRTRTLLFSHACHPTVVGGDKLQFTAEWPGAAVSHLKRMILQGGEESGWTEDALPLCLVGCCGDVNPVRRDHWEAVAHAGAQVGSAAHTARWNAHGRLDETLDAEEITIELPLMPPLPVAECERLMREAGERLEAARQGGVSRGRLMIEEGMLDWAQEMHSLALDPEPPMTRPFAIQRLTLGGLQLLGFPAEMFVRYQLDLGAQCPDPLMVLGVTNGCWGYLPTTAEYARGGYEVEEAHKYYGERMFAPESEALVRAAAYRLLGVSNPDTTPYGLV